MDDFKLFCKYNLIDNEGIEKNAEMINHLKHRNVDKNLYIFEDQNPSILILMHGNYSCNLNCIYCEHHLLREDYQTAIMTEEIAEQVILKLGPVTREITWHGGEPTLLPRSLVQRVEELKQKNNLTFRTTLQTNSVALTPDLIKFYDGLGIRFGTSFDGLFNDRNRGKKSTEAILNLLKTDPSRAGFITVYINDTVEYMIENYEYYKTLGVKNFQSCIVRENIVENTNPYIITVEKSVKNFLKYFNYWIHDTNNPIGDNYLIRQLKRTLGITSVCEDVDCIRRWIIVDPFGNIGQCGHKQSESGFCNIKDIDDYKDLFYNNKYLSDIGKQKKLALQCRDKEKCPWYSVCFGGCMGNNYELDPTYTKLNDRMCNFNKNILYGIYDIIKDIDITEKEKYNPIFLDVLQNCNYFSLTEIKQIENGEILNA